MSLPLMSWIVRKENGGALDLRLLSRLGAVTVLSEHLRTEADTLVADGDLQMTPGNHVVDLITSLATEGAAKAPDRFARRQLVSATVGWHAASLSPAHRRVARIRMAVDKRSAYSTRHRSFYLQAPIANQRRRLADQRLPGARRDGARTEPTLPQRRARGAPVDAGPGHSRTPPDRVWG